MYTPIAMIPQISPWAQAPGNELISEEIFTFLPSRIFSFNIGKKISHNTRKTATDRIDPSVTVRHLFIWLFSSFDCFIIIRYSNTKCLTSVGHILFCYIRCILYFHCRNISTFFQDLICHFTGGITKVIIADR